MCQSKAKKTGADGRSGICRKKMVSAASKNRHRRPPPPPPPQEEESGALACAAWCVPPLDMVAKTPSRCLCDHIQRRDAPCHAAQESAPASSCGGGGGRLCLFLEAAALTIFFRHIPERPSAPVFLALCFDTRTEEVEKAIRPPSHRSGQSAALSSLASVG